MRKALAAILIAPLALGACISIQASAPGASLAAEPSRPAEDPARAALLARQPSGLYEVEPTHTSVHWRISHSGLSSYTARFDRISGSIQLDAASPERSTADIRIEAASVNTGLPNFDREIAQQVLKAGEHPTITFRSTGLTATSGHTGKLTGDLTMGGVTRPVTLDVTFNTGRVSPFARVQNIGFSASGSLKRSEWGMTNWLAFGIGDQIDFNIEAEFLKKD